MDNITSYRPLTSAQSLSDRPLELNSDSVRPVDVQQSLKPYVPNIFDLVFPTDRARRLTKATIPIEFLQSDAVDSSQLIGRGASFTVTRQAIPPGPEKIRVKTDMGGWIVEKVTDAPKRPAHIVYKSARVRFRDDGDPATPEDRRAMLSILTEFHALLHPPLHNHPNIITLLGLAWGSNPAVPQHRLPVLVIEYGDRGTLANVQSRSSPMNGSTKTQLCRGIANGLKAIHQQGIVHGDMKPENIIICSGENGVLIPKLADFGFAIVEDTVNESRYMGGSRIWRAPESYFPVAIPMLKQTDIYSFGLVVWSIASQTNDPFSLVLPSFPSQEERSSEIDRLKASDETLKICRFENWSLQWLLNVGTAAMGTMTGERQQLAQLLKTYGNTNPAVKQLVLSMLRNSLNYSAVMSSSFPPNLDSIFDCTLTKVPARRDLDGAIRLLEDTTADLNSRLQTLDLQTSVQDRPIFTPDASTSASNESTSTPIPSITTPNQSISTPHETSVNMATPDASSGMPKESLQTSQNPVPTTQYFITNTSNETKTFKRNVIRDARAKEQDSMADSRRQYLDPSAWLLQVWSNAVKYHRYSWQVVRDLEPSIQRIVHKSMLHLNDGPARFVLSALWFNGYGAGVDIQKTLDCLVEAAKEGHPFARANLHRVSLLCAKPLADDVPVMRYLKEATLRGSRQALLDLAQLAPEEGKHYRDLLRFAYGGVGAFWYLEDQWFYGLSQGSFLSADFDIETLGSKEILPTIVVNRRGDHIIHAAAAVGALSIISQLLKDGTLEVNQQNALGETAILCACRSGHPDVVLLLLNNGADASISAINGETPLHWLSSFEPQVNIAMLAKDLIQRGGAKVDAATNERVAHSKTFNSIDVDFNLPGSPLAWAVHDDNHLAVAFLLSKGADPEWTFPDSIMSPLLWAAFYHHIECLKLMVEHLEKTKEAPVTTEGKKDLRHTVLYEPLVRETIHAADNFSMCLRNGSRCLNKLKDTMLYLQEKTEKVNFKLEGDDTLLHYAVREGHEQVVRFALEHKWKVNEINEPAGRFGRTAILEAIRWNQIKLFRLLLKHGADPCILSASPYDESENGRIWSALHLFADQAHEEDMTLVDELIAAGVPVTGNPAHDIESPLSVSIRRNAFLLADYLRSKGASLETVTHQSALLRSRWNLTMLGHTIALNGRYCFDSLKYLLEAGANFVVCPETGFTALHLCASVPEGLTYLDGTPLRRTEYDFGTNRSIANTILQYFSTPDQVNLRLLNIVPDWLMPKIREESEDVDGTLELFAEHGETALHLAVEVGNVHVAELLVRAGADTELVCYNETLEFETAADIAKRIWSERHLKTYHALMEILDSQ